LDTVMQLNTGSIGDISDTARRVTTHLIKNYKDSFMEAAERADVPICKPMSETAFAAMLKATNISGKQEVEMRKYLRDHLGKNFLPTRSPSEQKIDPNPKNVKRVTTTSGGDHGGDAFQFGSKVAVHFHNDTKPIIFEISVGEVICRTDSSELLEKTLVPKLTPGLEKIAKTKLWIYLDADNLIKCEFGDKPKDLADTHMKCIDKIFLYITGDLSFYAMALGRESMSGHWCFLCKLCRSKFAKTDEIGDMWTMEELLEVAAEVDGGAAKQGVKAKPWWPFIPLRNYMIPLLHVLIGIGNDLLESFRDWVNEEVECLDHQEVLTRRAVRTAEHKIIDTIAERDDWDAAPKGKKRTSLLGMIRRRMQKLERLGAIISIVNDTNENEDNSPVDVSELLQEFQEFVDDDNDLEEDVNPGFFADEEGGGVGLLAEEDDDDEEDDSEYRIQIPASV
ncbi:hypothetical protein ACHAXR_003439, partial [Thalassiosira sp. AJA248-18]